MAEPVIKIKRRGDDGYKLISVRIREDTLEALDKLAAETNYSRNELINLLLRYGADHVKIEWIRPGKDQREQDGTGNERRIAMGVRKAVQIQ